MEHYVVYDKATGDVRYRGAGPEGSAAIQILDADAAVMIVPVAAIKGADIDFEVIRHVANGQVDRAAEAMRLRNVTDGAGQALTYQTKAAEAAAYLMDDTATVPFLDAEADARGMTVGDLAAEVSSRSAQWTSIGSRIEALRMGAKTAINAATNLAQVADAIVIDWAGLET